MPWLYNIIACLHFLRAAGTYYCHAQNLSDNVKSGNIPCTFATQVINKQCPGVLGRSSI